MNLTFCSVALAFTLAAQEEPAKLKAAREPLPAVRTSYDLAVQKEPLLPKAERPESSAPAGDGRLSVVVQPERKSFPANGPLAITVKLKNVSEKPLSVWGLETLGRHPELVLVHLKTGSQVKIAGAGAAELKGDPFVLEPGKAVERTLVVRSRPIAVRPPILLPQPRPVPLPAPLPGNLEGRQRIRFDGDAQADKIAPPAGGVIPAPASLLAEGMVRMRLMLEFTAPENGDKPAYLGKLASDPIDLELTAAVFRPPVVGPVGPPANREQAIALAHPAAEAALNAAYNPIDPVRPAHVGPWIAEPATTAEVKELPGGGWTVSWTHTPKGKGHSHHVVISVAASGQAVVKEVFAGYSNR